VAIITLTTDFGMQDHFVAALKGVILGITPSATIVDVSHAITAFDILDGALTIASSYKYFPDGSVHVVVVDPGVGSARRPLVARIGTHHFVGPDNGVLSAVGAGEVRHLTSKDYFLPSVSKTFHARDIFAPVAAHLAKGVEMAALGPEISDYVRLEIPRARLDENVWRGVVLKVDRFGNLITNIGPQHVPALFHSHGAAFQMVLGGREINKIFSSYSSGTAGEVFAIAGSMGYLEIAANQGSAAKILNVSKGAEFTLALPEKPPRKVIRV
jgi:S-adenosyl-L-methionine hydrolase (adenosine-forming)